MSLLRLPMPALRPFVAQLWASGDPLGVPSPAPWREHALPSGAMHLVVRLTDSPLRIADPLAGEGSRAVAPSLVGGMRSRYYVRELHTPSCSVGAVLRPGAAEHLFGVTAEALAGRHTSLEDLWGLAARDLRDRLLEQHGPEERLAVFEAELVARVPRVHGLHPAVAQALAQMPLGTPVAELVRLGGLSHRRFIELFRQSVGLAPKTFLRVHRFQRALPALRSGSSLAAVAADLGYSDQSHFNREFLAFSGVTPLAYRLRCGGELNHLPLTGR